MLKHRFKGLGAILGSQVDPEKTEELKKNKTDIENILSKILKLIKNKNEDQSKREGSPNSKDARTESELVGLIEEFYTQYQSLYALYDRLTGENGKVVSRRIETGASSISSSSSESDYFSSDEVDSNRRPLSENEHHTHINNNNNNNASVSEATSNYKFEASDRVRELEELLNCEKKEVESLKQQKSDLQLEIATKATESEQLGAKNSEMHERISELIAQTEGLSNKNRELEAQVQGMRDEKEDYAARMKDLESELESRRNQENELERQLRDKRYEINELKDRNDELKRAMAHTGEEMSALAKEQESKRNGGSMQVIALAVQVKDLRLEIERLKEEKRDLELKKEEREKEYSESIAKVFDQGKVIKQQAETIERMSGENEEVRIWSKKFRMNRQFTERRVEELAEETRRQLEDNIRILNQRLHVAEQLHNENKACFKLAKERYERKKRMLKEKIARYEEEEAKGVGITKLEIKPIDIVNGLELAAGKIEEHNVAFINRVSKMVEEVETARDWIKERKGEVKQAKDKVECLTALLDDKEEQEFLLREKVWNLEAKVSKEGGEKLNLTKSVSQLEKKVARLENSLKEKEEELVNLGEMKKEAIRQLCFLNDYHRSRCDYLKDYISKTRTITRP
ncbi:COP1-interactive protein 1-like [Senna tora]|uniref:COP1-interactive protein 1-like n=1 Tax=Senna tora TaxID=362788 RepID=A0A834TWT9_9FABA|nr:COP1-interactive protein 1-like [Senna tora]